MFCRNKIVKNRIGQRGGNHLILITTPQAKAIILCLQASAVSIYTDAPTESYAPMHLGICNLNWSRALRCIAVWTIQACQCNALLVHQCANAPMHQWTNTPMHQRPKKSQLSGWQTFTRKNFPDEVRKLFSRHVCQKHVNRFATCTKARTLICDMFYYTASPLKVYIHLLKHIQKRDW